jgi:hypothetical protein
MFCLLQISIKVHLHLRSLMSKTRVAATVASRTLAPWALQPQAGLILSVVATSIVSIRLLLQFTDLLLFFEFTAVNLPS